MVAADLEHLLPAHEEPRLAGRLVLEHLDEDDEIDDDDDDDEDDDDDILGHLELAAPALLPLLGLNNEPALIIENKSNWTMVENTRPRGSTDL